MSPPSVSGTERQHLNSCGLARLQEGLLFPWVERHNVGGEAAERKAGSLAAGTWRLGAVVCLGVFKSQRKICPGCQGIGEGERAHHLGKRMASHTHHLPTVGRLPGGVTLASALARPWGLPSARPLLASDGPSL